MGKGNHLNQQSSIGYNAEKETQKKINKFLSCSNVELQIDGQKCWDTFISRDIFVYSVP